MQKLANRLVIGSFLVFIFSLFFLNLIIPDREKSESENRKLQQFPQFSWSRLLSGDYMQDFDKYMTDQFILKDDWVGLKSDLERLFKKSENNGIYFGINSLSLQKHTIKSKCFCRRRRS